MTSFNQLTKTWNELSPSLKCNLEQKLITKIIVSKTVIWEIPSQWAWNRHLYCEKISQHQQTVLLITSQYQILQNSVKMRIFHENILGLSYKFRAPRKTLVPSHQTEQKIHGDQLKQCTQTVTTNHHLSSYCKTIDRSYTYM